MSNQTILGFQRRMASEEHSSNLGIFRFTFGTSTSGNSMEADRCETHPDDLMKHLSDRFAALVCAHLSSNTSLLSFLLFSLILSFPSLPPSLSLPPSQSLFLSLKLSASLPPSLLFFPLISPILLSTNVWMENISD